MSLAKTGYLHLLALLDALPAHLPDYIVRAPGPAGNVAPHIPDVNDYHPLLLPEDLAPARHRLRVCALRADQADAVRGLTTIEAMAQAP